ncbi:ParB family chromosome partitioning protein [Motilibacter peucedani]|uniref:ParB family chromosome partitioning protein n=1 Tax=Motilibacter peucedani TaxID=598650 RepID=A0A420XUY8_9ACTN|nr:ParB N-terminal domain-containing protein [Motilibacter peucedani]RKS80646.1 ParB family chromosome partitioning protein [Motilibacter peucedani]
MAQHSSTIEAGTGATVAYLDADPCILLVDVNVRTQVRLDKEFVASVKAQGVLVPIVAVRTTEGALRVRYGHRRTLAAIETGRETVPVIVAADESTDDAGQIDRLVGQYAENEHRTGLTVAEKVGVVEQLSAFGVSHAQISKRLGIKRDTVKDALAVAASPIAKKAAERYEATLTLDQAAVVAEFDALADEDTVKALLVDANTGGRQFAHIAQRARDERAEQERRQEFIASLGGVPIVERPSYRNDEPVKRLGRLLDQQGEPLTVETHAACLGHAAYVDKRTAWVPAPRPESDTTGEQGGQDTEDDDNALGATDLDLDPDAEDALYDDDEDDYPEDEQDGSWEETWEAEYVCTDPSRYGHTARYGGSSEAAPLKAAEMSEEQREEAREARRTVIANNKAWDSATTVRQEWLTGWLTRKSAPKGSGLFLAAAVASGSHALTQAFERNHPTGRVLLGLGEATSARIGAGQALAGLLSDVSEARAQVVTLGLVLGAHEAALGRHSWRNVDSGTRRYLTFLAENGYGLSDVERLACGEHPLPEVDEPDAA